MSPIVLNDHLSAIATTIIDAPVGKVWEAITSPELIKKYFFGTDTITDWQPGHPIQWKGQWKGREYTNKGMVLDFVPEHILRVSYFDSMSGKEDKPENYATVTYQLSGDGDQTPITVIQDNIMNDEEMEKMSNNWAEVLANLKKLVEKTGSLL